MTDIAIKYQKLLEEEKMRNEIYNILLKRKKCKFLLSLKQIQIMNLLCEGRNIEYIAKTLGNTKGTITHQLKRIYKKFGVYKKDKFHPMVYCVASYITEISK